jgi:hypothetical protein
LYDIYLGYGPTFAAITQNKEQMKEVVRMKQLNAELQKEVGVGKGERN